MKHPYLKAAITGVVCTVFTAIGSALSQILKLNEMGQIAVMATAVILSALIGLAVMTKSHFTLNDYGFSRRLGRNARDAWFYIPLLLAEILPIAMFGFQRTTLPMIALLALFTIGVGFNEEIYFRGIALKYLSDKGAKKAIVASSVIFGVLHAANAFGGKDLIYIAAQIVFAFLVGFVLAETVSITKNIWFAIIWHTVHDFIAMSTQNGLGERELLLGALQIIIMLVYAAWLWRKVTSPPIRARTLPAFRRQASR